MKPMPLWPVSLASCPVVLQNARSAVQLTNQQRAEVRPAGTLPRQPVCFGLWGAS